MTHKKILYLDMDGVLVDFWSGVHRMPPEVVEQHGPHPEDIPGVYARMDPMPGALDAFSELAVLFDVYILSTAPWQNPTAWSDKLRWVQEHPGEAAEKRLILTHRKDLNRGDILVDDREKHGAGEFDGEVVLFSSEDCPDWGAVMKHLREVAAKG